MFTQLQLIKEIDCVIIQGEKQTASLCRNIRISNWQGAVFQKFSVITLCGLVVMYGKIQRSSDRPN